MTVETQTAFIGMEENERVWASLIQRNSALVKMLCAGVYTRRTIEAYYGWTEKYLSHKRKRGKANES